MRKIKVKYTKDLQEEFATNELMKHEMINYMFPESECEKSEEKRKMKIAFTHKLLVEYRHLQVRIDTKKNNDFDIADDTDIDEKKEKKQLSNTNTQGLENFQSDMKNLSPWFPNMLVNRIEKDKP